MLSKLINKEWRTEYSAETDRNGCVELKGFFGDYALVIDGEEYKIGLHRNGESEIELLL